MTPELLDTVLATDELERRPSRPPNYEAENRALRELLAAFARKPEEGLQKLVEMAMGLCDAEAAGLSVEERSGDEARMAWSVTAGQMAPLLGATLPRDDSPCGLVMDREASQLFSRPERAYPACLLVEPPISEALLAPFHKDGKPLGTLWVQNHGGGRPFDAEDRRLLESLTGFASIAYSEEVARQTAETERARYRSLFEAIDQGFCVFEVFFDDAGRGTDYRFLEVNPAFEEQTGLRAVDVLSGKTIRQLVPNLGERWFEVYGEVAKTGVPARIEERSEGLEGWFDVQAFRIGGEGSAIVGAIFTDVSQRRGIDDALAKERKRLQSLLQNAPAFTALLEGPELVFTFINDEYRKLIGHRDLVGLPVREAVPEAAGQGFLDLLEGVMRTGESFRGEELPIQLQRVPGGEPEERYVTFVYQAMHEADGSIYGVFAHGIDVTESVFARKQIAEQSARQERTLEEARVATFEWDIPNDVLHGNTLLGDFFGVERGKVGALPLGPFFQAIHPDDQAMVRAALDHSLAGDSSFEAEYRVKDRAGFERRVLARGETTFGPDGTALRLSGVVLDVTERARLVDELMKEREKLQTAFDQAPAFIAILRGRDLVFEYANEAHAEFSGRRAVVGFPLAQALPETVGGDEGQDYDQLIGSVLRSGEPRSFDSRPVILRRTPGAPPEKRYVDLSYQPLREADGTVSGVLVHGIDVTERVTAQKEIAEREELFRTVFETAPDDAILVLNGDRVITAWNPAAERICGWSAAEAIGQSGDILFTPEDLAAGAPEQEAVEAAENDKTADERWHVRKDGSRFWGSGTMNALHASDGSVRGYLKVFRDATERREMEEELREAVAHRTAELEHAIKESEGFNYSIAHDLRAPLRAMAATSSILLEELGEELDGEHRALLVRQNENAQRMGRLIDELLRLSRLARVEVKREQFDLTALARVVFDELAAHHRTNGCRFEPQEGMMADGDPGLVRMVLHNLIGNACKFSPRGGTIRMRERNGEIAISDEGVGFDMAFTHKLFLPFERLVTEAQFEGTGIGLANVDRIVKRHGGRVWAESAPGKGATFTFTLK